MTYANNADKDQNSVSTLIGVSSSDGVTPTRVAVDPSTGRVLVDVSGGSSGIMSINTDTTSAQVIAGTAGQVSVTDNGTGTHTLALISMAVTPGSYTNTNLTVDALGRITSAANGSAGSSGITIGTTTITSGTTTRILYDNAGVVGEYAISGSGNVAMTTSPSFTTPALGAATATTLNGVVITSASATLTLPSLATITFGQGMTLTAGAGAQTFTFPSTSATIARTDAAQTFTGVQTTTQLINTANAITASGNAATIPVTSKHNIVTNNSAATLTVTLATASAVNMQMVVVQILDFSAVAQTLTLINTENSTVSPPASTNGSTTLPLTLGFIFNSATTKWRLIASA